MVPIPRSVFVLIALIAVGCGPALCGPGTPPSGLTYATNPAVFDRWASVVDDATITNEGDAVSYAISPGLPPGLQLDTATGRISGKPSQVSPETRYTVTAANPAGSTSTTLTLTVKNVPIQVSVKYRDTPRAPDDAKPVKPEESAH